MSENGGIQTSFLPDPASENRRAPAAALTGALAQALADYAEQLQAAPLAATTRQTYLSRVRQYLPWLQGAELVGGPLSEERVRDWALPDYRNYLVTERRAKSAGMNIASASQAHAALANSASLVQGHLSRPL
jgi:hypothetical protein